MMFAQHMPDKSGDYLATDSESEGLRDDLDRPVPSSPRGREVALSRFFLAFESVPYRWLWSANGFAAMGISMRMLVQGWLVLDITDSPFWVGLAAGLQGLGLVGFGTFGGVLVDRLERRRLLMSAQVASGTLALIVGLLVVTDQIALWHILAVAIAQGVLQGVQLPVNHALIYQAVGPHRLLNAMAARMLAFNVMRIVGSLIAGALISSVGIWSVYMVAAGGMYVAATLIFFMRGTYRAPTEREPFWQVVSGGIRHVWGNAPLRMLLLLSLLMEAFGFSHMIMLPVMARDVLEVGAIGLGYLSAAGGAGAMVSTIVIAGLGDYRNKGRLLVGTAATAGLFLVLFAVSPWYLVSLGMVAVVGASIMAYDVTMGTLLQLLSPDAVRGRVMGLYGLTFGFTPLGGFLAGAIATAINAPFAISMGGVVIMAYVLRLLRPIGRIEATQEEVASQTE